MADSYTILRNFLNEAIKGTDTDAILYALSTGDDLLNSNSEAAVQNMFLATAAGEFLDYLASNVGVVRPNNIGISDDSLRNISQVFIGYKNTTNSINDLLKIYFSIYQTNAYVESENTNTFQLEDNDNLIFKLDNTSEYEVFFDSQYFDNIATASAVEVANYLNNYFLDLQINAIATTFLDTVTNSYTIRIISKTQGSHGAIEILGGTAQKALSFPSLITTTQTSTTQFTITQPRNGIFRFTWTGGQDPDFDAIEPDDYVIISGSGFDDVNLGTFTLVGVVSGNEDHSYFEIENVSGTTQTLTISNASDILFYESNSFTIIEREQYAAIFETTPGIIDLTIPASTSIVERTPTTGGSYLTEVTYQFALSGAVSFSLNETVIDPTTKASGIVLSVTSSVLILGDVQEAKALFGTSGSLYGETSRLTGTYTSYPTKTSDNELTGAYLYDLDSYVLTCTSSSLNSIINQNANNIIIDVLSTTGFPSSGYLVIDFGYDNEETLVPYVAILNAHQIQINPSYIFNKHHIVGADITILLNNEKYQVSNDGTDLGVYLTDVANARQNFVDNLIKIKSSGIFLEQQVLYPDDYGLPNAGTIYSDIIRVYGPDSSLDTDGFLKLV